MAAETRFEHADLTILLTETAREATMSWRGTSDARDPKAFLEPVFSRVIDKVKGRDLTIDFTGLEFMNSSTVSPIIALLKQLNENGIKSHVVFNNEDWQVVHMRCLRTIATVLRNVEVRGTA